MFFYFETFAAPHEKGSVIAEQKAPRYDDLIVDRQGNVVKKDRYIGSDSVNPFITNISNVWCLLKDTAVTYPILMTDEDEARF